MARPTKKVLSRRRNIEGGHLANLKIPSSSQWRNSKAVQAESVKKVLKKRPDVSQPYDQVQHLENARQRRAEKADEKKSQEKARQNAVLVTQLKKQVTNSQSSQSVPATSASPEKALALKRKAGVSDRGFSRINTFVRKACGYLIGSSRQLRSCRKKLEEIVEYVIHDDNEDQDDESEPKKSIRLLNVGRVLVEREKRLKLDPDQKKIVVLSLDKGHNRVRATVSYPNSKKPCSVFNFLPLIVWEGPDNYSELQERNVADYYEQLTKMGYEVLLGGDLLFLTTNAGLGNGMRFSCLWCSKEFDKGKNKDNDSIDFVKHPPRSKALEDMIATLKLVPKKEDVIPVPTNMVIPPILHTKIKVGNYLFEKMLALEGSSKAFKQVVKKRHLTVNRKEEGVIYHRFHGNDIKRLCVALPDFKQISTSTEYSKVIEAMEAFNDWAQLVSSTKTGLDLMKIAEIACKNQHTAEKDCCQTAILCAAPLEKVGGLGSSVLIHCIVSHLGSFLAQHRMIGAVAEEGIEAIHSKLETEIKRHKKSKIERLLQAVKWLGIQVLLNDAEEEVKEETFVN